MAYGAILRGWALSEKENRDKGIRQIRQGIAAYSDTGAVLGRPYFLSILIGAYVKKMQVQDGFKVLDEEAELYRLKGKLLLEENSDNFPEAEACFNQAITVARYQNAKSLELKATMSLSCLWQKQGKKDAARRILEEVYGRFTEGFNAPALKKAKILISESV